MPKNRDERSVWILFPLALFLIALYACEMRARYVEGDKDKKHMIEFFEDHHDE